MIKYLLLFFTMLFFLFCVMAHAEFYKWEDENGNTQITDYPPPPKSGKKVKVHKYDAGIQEEEQVSSKDTPKKESDVVLFTKDSCSDCDKAREFLKSKNIIFTEYNVDKDKQAAAKRNLIDDSEDVPLAIINKDRIHGFSESIYSKVLKLKP
ncbi:MAG: glutaredoxin family protein [Smithella sp.]